MTIAVGNISTSGAPVPEAAVNKNSGPFCLEREIWFANDLTRTNYPS